MVLLRRSIGWCWDSSVTVSTVCLWSDDSMLAPLLVPRADLANAAHAGVSELNGATNAYCIDDCNANAGIRYTVVVQPQWPRERHVVGLRPTIWRIDYTRFAEVFVCALLPPSLMIRAFYAIMPEGRGVGNARISVCACSYLRGI